MKVSLLILFFIASLAVKAQPGKIDVLSFGTYQISGSAAAKFTSDATILLDESHYKLRNDATVGDYKFSATAQRLLFLTGPLKGVFARTVLSRGEHAILLPVKENEELGFRFADADIVALYKKHK